MKLPLLHNMKLFQKFVLTYCILLIIPILIISSYAYAKLSNIITDNFLNSASESFEQSLDYMNYTVYKIFDTSNTIVVNNTVTDILIRDVETYALTDQIYDFSKLQSYLCSFENNLDIKKINLYINDGLIYSSENVSFFKASSLKNTKVEDCILRTNARFIWGPMWYLNESTVNDTLFLLKSIKNPDDLSEDIGFLRIDFRKSIIQDIIDKINPLDDVFSFVINSDNKIIASSRDLKDLYDNSSIDLELIKSAAQFSNQLTTFDDGKFYLQSAAIDKTDWYMVNVLPKSSILSTIKTQRNYLFIIVILTIIMAIILAAYLVKVINKRLFQVIDGMRQVPNGQLSNYIENDSSDEVGELIDNYNYMISKMSILVDEQYKLGKEVKNAELKALQSQINPHFLYNTLDMINWMAHKNMNKEISIAVKNLAKFYKLSLNKGKDIVTIKDEVEHSKLYVNLQNMRYDNRITLITKLDESLMNCSIPKITFQPIIENSINHGILGRGMENGSILISGYISQNNLIIQISDDGIGIEKEVLPLILKENNLQTKGSGYGLKNINQRIKLLYGESYGLSFTSNYGFGTTVEITLPVIR
ncbi:MAG: cache domain-containing sensor histidine kinase [Clostridium sp.]